MTRRVLLRAKSGPLVGLGHLMRTRAVAEEVRARGGEPCLVVDDAESARLLGELGLEAWSVHERPAWASEPAAGAWLDGFVDWTDDLRALARQRTPSYLVENRTPAREWASHVVHPNLHHDPDPWERVHASRLLSGPTWIPLVATVREQRAAPIRDLDLFVTFGGSDPLRSTERVLAALPAGLRVAVSVGAYMTERRAAVAAAAAHLAVELLPAGAHPAPWMARARAAVTALGTTLYELAYLRTPALVLANHEDDRPVLEVYRQIGPFRPLGLARELDDAALAAALANKIATSSAPCAPVPGLGEGAARLAERLLGGESATRAA